MKTFIFPFKSITSEFLKGQRVRMKDSEGNIHSMELINKKLIGQQKSDNLFYFSIECDSYCMISQFRVFVDNNKSAVANVQDMICYEIPHLDDYEEIVSSYETFVGSKCDYDYLYNYIDNNYPYIHSNKEYDRLLAFNTQHPTQDIHQDIHQDPPKKEATFSLLKVKIGLDTICKIYYNTISEMEVAQGILSYTSDYEYLNYEYKNILKELVTFAFESNSSISEIHRKFLEIKYAEGWEYAESYNDYSKTDPKMSEKASELQITQYTFLQYLTNIFELNG